MAGLWWAIALGVAWALLLGLCFAAWLHRVHATQFPGMSAAQWRGTAHFAGAIGGASEMTLIAERQGARTDLVAAAHSLRVLLVTVTIPFALQWARVHGIDPLAPAARAVNADGLAALAGITLAGGLLMQRLGRASFEPVYRWRYRQT